MPTLANDWCHPRSSRSSEWVFRGASVNILKSVCQHQDWKFFMTRPREINKWNPFFQHVSLMNYLSLFLISSVFALVLPQSAFSVVLLVWRSPQASSGKSLALYFMALRDMNLRLLAFTHQGFSKALYPKTRHMKTMYINSKLMDRHLQGPPQLIVQNERCWPCIFLFQRTVFV